LNQIPGTQYKIINFPFLPIDLSVRSFYSGVVFPTTAQAYQCADHPQEACQFAHAKGVLDIFV
jgi:hypothetical protein